MNAKSKVLFLGIIAALILVVSPLFPQMQTEVLAAEASEITIQVENKELYEYLVKYCSSKEYSFKEDGSSRKITLNIDKVSEIEIKDVDLTKDNSSDVIKELVKGCDKLKRLYLVNTHLTKVPDLKSRSVESLCLAKNNLSANGACDAITRDNFPGLKNLYLGRCDLVNLDFIKNTGGGLVELSLANNNLTDASLTSLLDMQGALADLETLELGRKVFQGNGGTSISDNGNNLTDMEKLALIPERFPRLTELDLSALKITSLQAFRNLRDGVHIDFSKNLISDFAGMENKNVTLGEQSIPVYGNFAPDWECEVPELVKNILDQNHIFNGSLVNPRYCHLPPDGEKITFDAGESKAFVEVNGGKLDGSTIRFENIRKVPNYTIPQGLTATEGDTLAKVILPEGFAWKDSALFVGEVGTRSFKGIYTPKDTGKYISLEVDIPVTVKKAETNSTEVTPGPKPIPDPSPEPDEPDKPDESNLTGNQIEARKDLSLLLATGKQKGKNGIELTWKKKNGSSGYEVYWSYCDGKRNYQKAKTVKSTGRRSYIHKNLKKSRAYKYYIVSYKIKGGKKFYQSKSPVIHVAMSQEKSTNVKSITVNKTKVSLKAKKTFQIKASAKAENKKKKLLAHTDKFRYYTNDKKVAEVTRKGKIRAKKKGSCSIFVIANNGVSKEIKVTVK